MELSFASPRKLPRPQELKGRVAVVDIAFASEASGKDGFTTVTLPFIEGLGPRLAAWVDHHDSLAHERYRDDPRFTLATKAEHPACPEMISPALVERTGVIETIVCHTDFDGIVSAAKWIRRGVEPYPGADEDARAIDTRLGRPSATAARFDRALRARPRDHGLFGLMVRHLVDGLADASLWGTIDAAAAELRAIESETARVAQGYVRLSPGVAFVDCSSRKGSIDKTQLLLLGQERETVAVVVDRDTVTLAAPFDSGVNFLSLLGLSGGMPTRVSVPRSRLDDVCKALHVNPVEARLALQVE